MAFFTGGISDAGRAAIVAAVPGALELGYVRVGSISVSGGTVMDDASTNAIGSPVQYSVENIFYTVFGSNRITLFVELNNTLEVPIGNVMFFLSSGVPLAWGQFDYQITKAEKAPDTAGDWIVLSLSLNLLGMVEKFTLDPEQSTSFILPKSQTQETAVIDFSVNRRMVAMVKETIGGFDLPSIMTKGKKWYINPFFVEVESDLVEMSGGTVGDSYDRSI
jgi:hypothetical protein